MKSWPEISQEPLPVNFKLPPLEVFDSYSGRKHSFEFSNNRNIYVCGITPYDATHLGHAATYLTFDLINRYWRAQGSKVNYIQNITDIDDPLLERASRDKVDWKVLANSQIDLFRSDMVALRIHPPKIYAGAVDEIPTVITAIQKLEKHVYKVENDLYLSIKDDKDYGELSKLNELEALKIFAERGGDPDRSSKMDKFDPLLWLSKREGEPAWTSPFGEGRPGWHIECASIALKYSQKSNGAVLDVQGGGSDLIFPHHEMSASQIKLMSDRNLADAYVHTGLIGLAGEKMSKSKGNLVFVSDLIAKGVNPMAIRWALFNRPYRAETMWSEELLTEAISHIETFRVGLSRTDVPPTNSVIDLIAKAIANDLDTETALRSLLQWSSTDGSGGNSGELSRAVDSLLGIAL